MGEAMTPSPPQTLPADFFSKQQAAPPDTLPADFFAKGSPSFPKGSGTGSLPDVTNEDIKSFGRKALGYAPAVGATAATLMTGGGAIPAIGAAMLGGAGGSALKQGVLAATGSKDAPKTMNEAAGNIAEDTAEQGMYEAGGRFIARPLEYIGKKILPESLQRGAVNSYRKMLAPGSAQAVPQAEKTAQSLAAGSDIGLNRPVAMTREGMVGKAKEVTGRVGPQAGIAYDAKPPVDPQPVLDQLAKLRNQKTIVKGTSVVVDKPLDDAIKSIAADIDNMRDASGMVPAAALDDYRDKLFSGNVSATGLMRQTAPQSAAHVENQGAGYIRSYLDSLYPDVKPINDAYSTAKKTGTFLEQSRRKEIAAESGIRTGSASGFGAQLKRMLPAPVRGLPNALSAATDSVAWDSVVGATKAELADLLRSKRFDQALVVVRSLPKIGGAAIDASQPINTQRPGFGQLPHYAKGGIIRKPTLLSDLKTGKPTGIMAEAGPEEIKPLAAPEMGREVSDLSSQLDELTGRKRRAVRIPSGTFPRSIPEGMVVHADPTSGDKIVFNPHLTSIHDVKTAVATKRLAPLLGHTHSPSAMSSLKHIMKQSRKSANRSLKPTV